MSNLIAYVPVINQMYIRWLRTHPDNTLHLISQRLAESLEPKLARLVGAVNTETIQFMLSQTCFTKKVCVLDLHNVEEVLAGLHTQKGVYMPNEDLSHQFVEKYARSLLVQPTYETVWGRWDMSAVKKAQPIIPDCEVSIENTDVYRIAQTYKIAQQSSDWWRQIGALIFKPGEQQAIAGAFNVHYPSPYDLGIRGDMRIYVDAGDTDAKELYSSLHAERVLISRCARMGVKLDGSSMYINVFPCGDCARWIIEAGIKELFFCEGSSFLDGFHSLKTHGVRIVQVKTPVIS